MTKLDHNQFSEIADLVFHPAMTEAKLNGPSVSSNELLPGLTSTDRLIAIIAMLLTVAMAAYYYVAIMHPESTGIKAVHDFVAYIIGN